MTRTAPLEIRKPTPLGMNRDSRVLVVGLGKTGMSIVRYLSARGIPAAVVDSRDKPPGLSELSSEFPDTAVFLGGFEAFAFKAATHLVVSPGVALDTPAIQESMAQGVPMLGDIDLFAAEAQAPTLAITGANGKSTVTTLLGLMAELDGRRVRVGGNLGTPALDLLDPEADLYVLELSSFQLERTQLLEPLAATVLNISPDHMDRYPDLETYAEAKRRIFRGNGTIILNADDPIVAAMCEVGRVCRFFGLSEANEPDYLPRMLDGDEWLLASDEPVLRRRELKITGRHNVANALAAMALADAAEISRDAQQRAMRQFGGLDHRMQWVAEVDGVPYINDSKATNVGATIAALEGLDGVAVLIAGGDGKGADFNMLRDVVRRKVRAVVLIGRDTPLLEAALGDLVPTQRAQNMAAAVAAARSFAQSGDTVLLAPACASLDQYKDYQERGRIFSEAVRGLV